MIFKPFKGGLATVAYQMRNPTAKVLIGNPRMTSRLIQESRFAQPYCGMTLSFEEEISPADEAKILDEFVSLIRGGLEPDALDILVVRHRDKKHPTTGKVRPDYHITTVETELRTGKKITVYEGFKNRKCIDHDLFYAWERMTNIRYGFSRPDDPARRRTINIAKNLPEEKKADLAAIDEAVQQEILAGRIKDRSDVVDFLVQSGFQVTGQVNKFISIKREGWTKNTRLKGLFYEREFHVGKLAKSPAGTAAGAGGREPENLGNVEKRFSELFDKRVERFQKLYRTGPNKIKAAALGGADDYDFVHHADILFDPVHSPIRPEVERPSAVVFGEPPCFRRVGGIESGSSRRPGEVTGRTDADRSETIEGVNYEKTTVRVVQDFLGEVGRIDRRARAANEIIGGRARGTAEKTAGIFRAAAAAMGAESERIIYAGSGFRDTVAGFVQVVEAFDQAVRIARNPLGFLAQTLIKLIKKKELERLPVPPKISFP
jgi:hypothetical protein